MDVWSVTFKRLENKSMNVSKYCLNTLKYNLKLGHKIILYN